MNNAVKFLLIGGLVVAAWPFLMDFAAPRVRRYREPDHIVNRDATLRLTSPRVGGGVPILNRSHYRYEMMPLKRRDNLRLRKQVKLHTGLVGGPRWREEFGPSDAL